MPEEIYITSDYGQMTMYHISYVYFHRRQNFATFVVQSQSMQFWTCEIFVYMYAAANQTNLCALSECYLSEFYRAMAYGFATSS